MKNKSIVSTKFSTLMLLALIILSPFLGIAQTPGSPGGGTGGAPGGEAGAVPFDDNMNLIFLVAGIAFAVMITVKQLRKKVVVSK